MTSHAHDSPAPRRESNRAGAGAGAALGLRGTVPARERDEQGRPHAGGEDQRGESADVAEARALRLLIPIDATERSRWAVRHAAAHWRADTPTEVHLLFVAEPITRWEVLRFRTQAEIAKFQAERAHWLLEDAAAPLRQAGIATMTHFREGDAAFEILDTAEQLGCTRIALPQPLPRWRTLLRRDLVRDVSARARGVHIVTIGPDGEPAP